MQDRVIPLQGIHNLRDYGGYATKSGAKVKRGVLWRSGQHGDATADDLDAIARLNLATVVDLRGDSERTMSPCLRHPDFTAKVLLVDGETAGSATHAPHVAAAEGTRTVADAHAAMMAIYHPMPFRPKLVAIFRLYYDALATREGASLLHCMAGKDRTGLAVALLHHLLGVHPDDVLADYLLTNEAGNLDRRVAAGAATVRKNFGAHMDDEAIRMLMSVQPEFLDAAMRSIRDAHGSVEAYAEAVLGVNAGKRAMLAERLLD